MPGKAWIPNPQRQSSTLWFPALHMVIIVQRPGYEAVNLGMHGSSPADHPISRIASITADALGFYPRDQGSNPWRSTNLLTSERTTLRYQHAQPPILVAVISALPKSGIGVGVHAYVKYRFLPHHLKPRACKPGVFALTTSSYSIREWRNGIRGSFRSYCPYGRGGSSPPSRTNHVQVAELAYAAV